ncbi:Re/Si-specific NAD(P)(+) transhydrogenase subunit alpha [Rarobacter faecitabidus]|uniref:proton-translocating NAD(P)(+) transhydrogenase n=1 Tax=Rarobacter faecitabidus TaxID=13243 RepID=A0A542ZU17_RARFA|nr:Re/Si-specific NAD(P)(+) transhydrogenase subunit alpha [Rarobacter faecitabidus]TQL63817.1 NAD(P) transhydrogenase subunit alpha [Rarobacter faecitabidus]
MRIGVPTEAAPHQRIVAATPKTVAKLISLGYEVAIEAGAGTRASFPDSAYIAAGAVVAPAASVWAADIVIKMDEPSVAEIATMRPGATVISRMAPSDRPDLVDALRDHGVTGLCLDAVPRISRAQSLDVLSSMSNIAGYRAVIEAAEAYGGMFGGQVTAAGKTAPASVFVIGAGVAGLAALGAAGSLGAQVRAFDVRPEVAEQIESMGAVFVRSAGQQEVSADGYAKPLTEEQLQATAETYAEESAKADVVITTALVRGKAVRTITAAMVASMRPGSVIVDLAASGGGNCELTVPGEKIVTGNGVTIVGYTDLPGRMASQASQLYGTNIVNLLVLLTPAKDGALTLDMDDIVQRSITVTRDGEVLWPPPPVQVSAAPQADAAPATPAEDPAQAAERAKLAAKRKEQKMLAYGGLAAVLIGLAITFSPVAFVGYFTVFILAVFIGFYVITNVSHSLHTPLMAQTNAISGIILVGAILQLGSSNPWVVALAFAAATVASINIFGGFLVASRMINMFRKEA